MNKQGYIDLVKRIRTRAEIRRKIPRPEPDRISKDLEDAAQAIEELLVLYPTELTEGNSQ